MAMVEESHGVDELGFAGIYGVLCCESVIVHFFREWGRQTGIISILHYWRPLNGALAFFLYGKQGSGGGDPAEECM
jgi:hypothetical protein